MSMASWRYYLGLYRGSYRGLAAGVLASVAQVVVLLPIPLLVRYVLDTVIPERQLDRLAWIGLGILVLYLLNGAMMLWTRQVVLVTTKTAIRRVRDDLLQKVYTFSRAHYSGLDLGQLHTVIVQDTERLDVMSNALVALLIPSVLISLALCAVLLYLNWFLFLVMIAVLPLLLVSGKVLGRRVRQLVLAFQRSFETFSKGALFVLQAFDLTRMQSAEDTEMARQRANLQDLRVTSGRMALLNTAYALVQDATVTVSGVIVLIIGGSAVAAGTMTLGEILSFYVTVGLLRTYLSTALSSVPQIITGNESLATICRVLRTDDSQPYCGTARVDFRGGVSLEGVTFGYGERTVLHEVSLEIRPGELAALVGPNGAGKSTIANLILGFYRPQTGRLLADGRPFDELDVAALRRGMGVVAQDPIIFPGTIRENITYGFPEATEGEVDEAAALATAREFIGGLERGYDTLVGENGMLLSGGQRQRIAIARALLRRPRLLILDEPTNHLDAAAVRQLMANLKALDPAPAALVISHDPEILKEARSVYVLREGRLVAGDPDTLGGNGDAA